MRPVGRALPEKQRGDQEAADDEEHVDADETARQHRRREQMVGDHQHHSDRPQPVEARVAGGGGGGRVRRHGPSRRGSSSLRPPPTRASSRCGRPKLRRCASGSTSLMTAPTFAGGRANPACAPCRRPSRVHSAVCWAATRVWSWPGAPMPVCTPRARWPTSISTTASASACSPGARGRVPHRPTR